MSNDKRNAVDTPGSKVRPYRTPVVVEFGDVRRLTGAGITDVGENKGAGGELKMA